MILDLIAANHFSAGEPDVFRPILDALLPHGDYYLHFADLRSYAGAHARLAELYQRPEEWMRKAILNIAGSGRFSSDRTIAGYVCEIWGVAPCAVPP
jgi:glycogen phosphorylase